ncbi:CAP domain-containing protein [Saccharothrix variisporea]|uniref:Uncharacterized protein YkwD n=1 Tax=Saccharothrix variisporea TaxID=543527 RepID=A0A495XNG0_9PSEU|nr:CAP domain-containing protein [Saccharothrix variisporea]RKT74436.1 uncharacterized protein YkwD [Saccharothrix variisporea]
MGRGRAVDTVTRWGDRELLSLWLLEGSGYLTRADIAEALGLDPHTLTVRVSRLKGRLEGARMVVRALSLSPWCPQLAKTATEWPGEPSSLWRKRFLRHISVCRRCHAAGSDLLPTERLFVGLALLPLPADYTIRVLSSVHSAAGGSADGAALPTAKPVGHRIVQFVTTKPALTVAGVAAACAMTLTAVAVPRLLSEAAPAARPQATKLEVAQSQAVLTNTSATPAAVPPTTPTTFSPVPTTVVTTTPPPPLTTTTPTPPQPAPPTHQPLTAEATSGRLLTLLNERRRTLGLPEVNESSDLVEAARSCAEKSARQDELEHCGHEVLFASSGTGTTPEEIMAAWFTSPAHKQALTYASSRNAGAAIILANGRLVAALNIDY